MSAIKLDGRRAADRMLVQLKKRVRRIRRPITLATILVGSRYDSSLYVRLKRRAAARVGIKTEAHHLPSTTKQAALTRLIRALNRRKNINGILLQFPLPPRLDADAAVRTIDPRKDVDGFHPVRSVASNGIHPHNAVVVPPPVAAVLRLVNLGQPPRGSFVAIVAQPSVFTVRLATELERRGFVPAVVEPHRNLKMITTKAGIVVTALGQGARLTARDVKRSAIIVDVGIRRHGKKTIGDVHPSAWKKAKAISPVPGGVGPLTVSCVLFNAYQLATR